MPETHFDEWIAERYEILWPELFDPAVIDPTVDFLAQLAAAGPALELGIGIGRIALPLGASEAFACTGSTCQQPGRAVSKAGRCRPPSTSPSATRDS
jgi:hypothetical protein